MCKLLLITMDNNSNAREMLQKAYRNTPKTYFRLAVGLIPCQLVKGLSNTGSGLKFFTR